ncbi:MAG: hypothetical protein HY078_10695, partial [Elusimicrobia bacterium]|nr:hypothetical protein [Elusimicrobiota bacterium]
AALAAAGAAADPATPPQNASAPPDQKKLEALGAEVQGERDHIVYLQNEWAKSHYGGQSAEQFNAILGAAQAKLAALTAKFQDYMNGVPGVA